MEQIKTPKPKERFIQEYACPGCNMTVQEKELEIPLGPHKGNWVKAYYGCKCQDNQIARQAEKKRKQRHAAKKKEMFDYYSLINGSLEQVTLENYQPTNNELANAKQNITNYIQEFDGITSLIITGDYGTGKSHLSVAATKELMEQGYECLFLSLPKLLTKIKDTYNNKGVTEDELLNAIQRVDLLVLDDIGAEHHTEWVNSKLFEIMDDRSGKSTIYTTNLNSAELRKQVNERNFSRMMENTKPIKMNGRDYRRKEF